MRGTQPSGVGRGPVNHLGCLDEMIISLYAGATTVRDIVFHLESPLGTDLSHETISKITDVVLDEVRPGIRGLSNI